MEGAPALARWLGLAPRDDLLAMLLEARDEETGEGMTDRQLRDELVTLFLAGHETTAISLAWTFHLLAQNPAADTKLHAYLPFGGGPRICIGNSFAMMEHAIVLAAVVRRWRLESVPGHQVRTEPRITLRPRGGLPMHVLRRVQS